MGHSSVKTTEIYLEFSQIMVDKARNRVDYNFGIQLVK